MGRSHFPAAVQWPPMNLSAATVSLQLADLFQDLTAELSGTQWRFSHRYLLFLFIFC